MKIEGGTFLVTGGAGFIPSHLIEMLLDKGAGRVVSFDNFSRGRKENLLEVLKSEKFDFYEGDLRDTKLLNKIIEGVDAVFHMASMCLSYCQENPLDGFDVNVNGTFNLIEACVKNKVKRFVYSSSSSIYGNASYSPMDEEHPLNNENFYGASKICGEYMLSAFYNKYNIPYVNLRYMNVYGPRQDYMGTYVAVIMNIIDNIHNGKNPIIHGDGLQKFDFVYVGDACRANICALESDKCDESYNISTGIQTSIIEIAELIMSVMDYSGEVEFFNTDHNVLVTNRIGSTKKAEKELGFEADVLIRDGLRKTIDWRKVMEV